MTNDTPLPWDELSDAFARLEDAIRADDATELAAARANVERAKEHLAALGGLLFLMMLDHGTDAIRARLARIVGELTNPFCDQAQKASRLSRRAWNEVDALRQELRELREELARRTPGVGEPVDEEDTVIA